MKTLKFDDAEKSPEENQSDWMSARRGIITGTRLKDLYSKRDTTKKKVGFYELIAERLAVPRDDENPMDRGVRLEEEALVRFSKETKKKVDWGLVLWVRDDNAAIAVSPDGVGKDFAVEVKCLSSAKHIEALLTQKIPDEYEMQIYQYFLVNDKLKTLYVVFYDPSLQFKDFFFLTVKREDIEEQIAEYLEYEKRVLSEVDGIVMQLSF